MYTYIPSLSSLPPTPLPKDAVIFLPHSTSKLCPPSCIYVHGFWMQTQEFAYGLIKHCIVQRSVMEIGVFVSVMNRQWYISIFLGGGM